MKYKNFHSDKVKMFPHLLLFDHIRSRNVDEDVIKGICRERERTIMMTTSSPIIKHTRLYLYVRVPIKSYSHLF